MILTAGTTRRWANLVGAATVLAAGTVQAQTVNFGGHTLKTNAAVTSATGTVELTGDSLRMSNGEYDSARSALTVQQFNLLDNWSTTFRMRVDCAGVPVKDFGCPGDGLAFVATAGGTDQVGVGGYGLGYMIPDGNPSTAFSQSAAVGLQTFWQTLIVGVNGKQVDEVSAPFSTAVPYTGMFNVSLSYDASISELFTSIGWGTELFTHTFTGFSFDPWAASARVGFTSATGAAAEYSWIADWEFQGTPVSTVPEPSTVLLLGAGLAGLVLVVSRRRRTT